jgi:hypothetical protein
VIKPKLPVLLLFFLLLCFGVVGKDREWLSGTVAAVESHPARVMRESAAVEYTIRTESANYVLEDAAFSYYTGPPKEFLGVGDIVHISLDGSKHALIQRSSGEKRLRVIRVSRAENRKH